MKDSLFTGVQVNYYFICPTKLWFFSRGISLEESSELVELGKLLHELKYGRMEKDVKLERIAFDFIKKGNIIEIHEIKKTTKMKNADYWQVVYYLYYLKKLGINTIGFIHYPKKLKVERIELTPELEEKIVKILGDINKIASSENPPKPVKKPYCRKCAYYELCWS